MRVHVYTKKYKWLVVRWYTTRERCITILYHAMENTVTNTITATYARRIMGRLDVITAFLFSDWLYFLWHEQNSVITLKYCVNEGDTQLKTLE